MEKINSNVNPVLPPLKIEQFPEEILLKIFSYLPTAELTSLACVSKTFSRISSDKNLGKLSPAAAEAEAFFRILSCPINFLFAMRERK